MGVPKMGKFCGFASVTAESNILFRVTYLDVVKLGAAVATGEKTQASNSANIPNRLIHAFIEFGNCSAADATVSTTPNIKTMGPVE